MFNEGGRETTVVDIHCHMTPAGAILAGQKGEEWHGVQMQQNDSGNLTWELGGHRMKLTWENPSLGWESRLEKMDQIGVDVQVMSLSPAMYWYGHLGKERSLGFAQEANDSIAEAMAEHPTRFQGLAHLPLQDAQASVKELERCVKELGMAGVAVPGNVVGTDWDSPELYPIIEAAAGLDVVFFIHPASDVRFPPEDRYWFRNIIGIPLEETISLASLIFSGVFDKHPDLKVCMAHGGGFACFGLGRFDHAHKVRPEAQHLPKRPSDYASNVWFDSLTHSYPKLRYLLDEIGGTKVVLGTDYPADMGQTEPVEWVRGADNLTTDERHAVLGGNVEALLGDRMKAFARDERARTASEPVPGGSPMSTLYASWLEGDDDAISDYMAALREMPGVVHTAVYKPGGKGPQMIELASRHDELDLPVLVEHPPSAWALALLDCPAAGLTITEKLGPRPYRHAQYPGTFQEDFRIADGPAKIVLTQVLLHQISYVPGVAETGDFVFADAVQFGVLSTRSVETEWTILDWYERYRLLAAESIPGLVRARRYVSIAGFAKFGILYEFLSLEARLKGFEEVHESRSLDPDDPWKLGTFALHTPGAPFVGARVEL